MVRSFSKRIIFVLVFIILLSTAFEFRYVDWSPSPIHGYWQTGDQYWEVPAAIMLSGEGYYSKDVMLQHFTALYPSWLFQFEGYLLSYVGDMVVLYAMLFFILKSIFLVSTYLLANKLLNSNKMALIATVLVSFTHFMGADEVGIAEVIPHSFVFAFMPIFLYAFIRWRERAVLPIFTLLAVLTYFHPYNVIPLIALFSFSLLKKKQIKPLLIGILSFAILSAPYFMGAFLEKEPFDLDLYNDIYQMGFLYPENAAVSLGKFFLVFIPGLYIINKRSKEVWDWCLILIAYSSITLLGLVNTDILMIQFFKAFKYVIYFSFIFIPLILKRFKLPLALLLFLVVFIPFSSIHYSTISPTHYGKNNVYLDSIDDVRFLGEWASKNTARDAVFLIPPKWGSMRTWLKRSIVVSHNDVAVSTFSQSLGSIFRERYFPIVNAYESKNIALIKEVGENFGADYIIVEKDRHPHANDPLFSSEKFLVYKID